VKTIREKEAVDNRLNGRKHQALVLANIYASQGAKTSQGREAIVQLTQLLAGVETPAELWEILSVIEPP